MVDALGLLGGALLAQAGGRAGALCWGSAQASGIRANHARYCSLPSPSGELTMGTNPQAGDRSPVRECVGAGWRWGDEQGMEDGCGGEG